MEKEKGKEEGTEKQEERGGEERVERQKTIKT